MRVLIIGANGFIGRHLGQRLKEIPDAQVSGTFSFHAPMHQDHPWYQMELTDEQQTEQVFTLVEPDVVVHLAAIADVKEAEIEPERATAVNVGGLLPFQRHQYVVENFAGHVPKFDQDASRYKHLG